MSRRAPRIRPRRPIYLGCEGSSENGYGALLNRLASEIHTLHLHIHHEILQPGAGDPLALVQRAVERIANLQRRRATFAITAVLIDRGTAQKNAAAAALAAEHGIDHLIWQDPDHEGFLLRHMPGCAQHRPPQGASLATLRQHWPDYDKARSAHS